MRALYNDKKLVGIGFLLGGPRHAMLCDICVDPSNQGEGHGRKLVESLVQAADDLQIKYVTLTYDERSPWLADLYGSVGFERINNAMQLNWEKARE